MSNNCQNYDILRIFFMQESKMKQLLPNSSSSSIVSMYFKVLFFLLLLKNFLEFLSFFLNFLWKKWKKHSEKNVSHFFFTVVWGIFWVGPLWNVSMSMRISDWVEGLFLGFFCFMQPMVYSMCFATSSERTYSCIFILPLITYSND